MIHTAPTEADLHARRAQLDALRDAIGQAVVGQAEVVEQLLVALLAGGHVLLEGVPGLGKTLLVRTLGDALALERYAAWRRFDSLALVAVTDGINRLFANDLFPIRVAREAGLALVERLPVAKRFFMRHAMGLVGDLPRALQGRPL